MLICNILHDLRYDLHHDLYWSFFIELLQYDRVSSLR